MTQGQIFRANASDQPAWSTASYPDTVATGDLRYGSTTNVNSNLTVGSSGQVLTVSGGVPSWQTPSEVPVDPSSSLYLVDDFMGMSAGTVVNAALQWIAETTNGFKNGASLAVETSHPGIIGHTAITSGSASLIMGGGSASCTIIAIGGGQITIRWIFKINTLSDGSNRYTLNCGLGDSFSAGVDDQVNGLYFRYNDSDNSGNWVIKSSLASSRTTTNSAVAVTTGWHKAEIVVNAAGSSAEFFMDGVSLGSISATMPSSTTNISPMFSVRRSFGTIAANSVAIDLFYLYQTLTTSR